MMAVVDHGEKQWRAEEDARIIAQYLELMEDEERLKLASQVAEKRVAEIEKQLKAMKEVVKKGGKK